MKKFSSYIAESLNNVYANVFNGSWNQRSFATVEKAKAWIKSLKDVTYYDITRGDELSLVDNLVEWYGTKGFWYNVCYNPVMKQDRREKADAEKAKKKEVKEF